MIVCLKKKELGFVSGGKTFSCHILEVTTKSLEMGGMVFCLGLERIPILPRYINEMIQGERNHNAVAKFTCGMLIGGGVETFSHVVEFFIGR